MIQITDLHIGDVGESTHGVDTRANFLRILELAKEVLPDFLVLSGDCCFERGVFAVYDWMKEVLSDYGVPYAIIPGNHDDAALMAQAFDLESVVDDGSVCYAKRIGPLDWAFLDSSPFTVSRAQLDWLSDWLAQRAGDAHLFVHHPVFVSSVGYMDENHALRNMEEVQEVLFSHPHPVHVFCGHYHTERTVMQKNVVMHITPSCFFQLFPVGRRFKIDHQLIALREIQVEREALLTSVRYDWPEPELKP